MRRNPKFVVDERVKLKGVNCSAFDTDNTLVSKIRYKTQDEANTESCSYPIYLGMPGFGKPGWRYQLAHQSNKDLWFMEESLIKLPDQGQSFDEMMSNLSIRNVVMT